MTEAERDEVLLEIRDMLAELVARRAHITPADRDLLKHLLPAIVGHLGSENFTTAEIKESDSRALREMVAHLSPNKLGKLLSRACDQAVSGYRVEKLGDGAGGVVIWRVGLANPQTNSRPLLQQIDTDT